MIFWLLTAVAVFLFYKWATSENDYFRKRGIPFNKPLFLVGSRLGLLLKNSTIFEFIDEIYNEFKNEK
jgi:cytochrome P450 family 9